MTHSAVSTRPRTAPSSRPSQTRLFRLDPAGCRIGFVATHMGSKVSGRLDLIEGTVVYDPDRPEATVVKGTISSGSVDTGNPIRDARLKSEEFFDASSFPQMTFVSNGAHFRRRVLEVMGDLTLRGTTRPVTLTIKRLTTESGKGEKVPSFKATARTTIHRLDFGVGLVTLAQIANSLIGDEVTIVIDAVLTPA